MTLNRGQKIIGSIIATGGLGAAVAFGLLMQSSGQSSSSPSINQLNNFFKKKTIQFQQSVNQNDTSSKQSRSPIMINNQQQQSTTNFSDSINESILKLSQWKVANTIPGYVIGVSIRGQNVWIHSDGFADIENAIPCSSDTVMRIASISKSITAALLGKMIQEKKVRLFIYLFFA